MILSDYEYNCASGDTFDIIALQAYGNEIYAAEVMCANPQYTDRLIFEGGEKVRLPLIENIPDRNEQVYTVDAAPWKE